MSEDEQRLTYEEWLAQETNRKAGVLVRLEQSTQQVLVELREIREELGERPTRLESTLRRRATAVALVLITVFAVQVNDLHIENCSPGAQTERGIRYVGDVDLGEFDADELQRLLNEPVPDVCDATFPTHTHNPHDDWPSSANLLGILIYVTSLVAGILWWRNPLRQPHPSGDKEISRG